MRYFHIRIEELEGTPAQAWADMKKTANCLADKLLELARQEAARVKETCGQDVSKFDLAFAEGEVEIDLTWGCVSVRTPVHGGAHFPINPDRHWYLRASDLRAMIELMARVAQHPGMVRDAVERSLDD